MEDRPPSTAELLTAWRDATRAAELAERLAIMAEEAAKLADRSSVASEQIAQLAERAARSAERAAKSARQAAARAAAFSRESRTNGVREAGETVAEARADEAVARKRYHAAEESARRRQGIKADGNGDG